MKTLEILDYRLPKWNLDDLKPRFCPLCGVGQNDELYVRPDKLIVKNCKICGLYYISPSPSNDQIDQFYQKYDSNHRKTINLKIDKLKLDSIYGTDNFGDLRIRKLSSVMKIQGSSFLDIGFGIPYFLYHLKKLGGNVFGIEQDEQAIGYAKQSGMEEVYGKLSDLPKNLKFDAILMNDLIEHPLDPLGLLDEAYNKLAPGGKILIWTPNGDYSKTDSQSTTFWVDLEHMQYFTTRSISFLATKLNLNVEHLECYGFPALSDLVAPQNSNQKTTLKLKMYLKNFYPFYVLNQFKRLYLKRKYEYNNRKGSYHLFVILGKK